MAKLLKTLSENVVWWRKKRGFSQQKLADRAHVGIHIVQRMEAGKTWPEIESLSKISTALGCEETDLFDPGKRPKVKVIEPSISDSIERAVEFLEALGDQKNPLIQKFLKERRNKE